MAVSDFATKRMQQLYSNGPLTRFGTQFAFDAAAWTFSLVLAALLRYDLNVDQISWGALLLLCAATVLVQLLAGWLFHLYRGRHPYGSFAEVRALLWAVVLTGLVVGVPILLFGPVVEIPRSLIAIAAPLALGLMGAVRYVKRLLVERAIRPTTDAEVALVYGAGYLGASIVRRMLTDRRSRYLPVGLIDDDPLKRRVWLDGVRVLGTRKDLAAIAEATGATLLVVTIARADAALLREISDAAILAGLNVKVLPPMEDIPEGKSRLRDLPEQSIEDLTGRHPVNTEAEAVAGYLADKTVLVTGAGGSIGTEFCRQVARFAPAELIMLDRDQTGLQQTQIGILGHGLLDTKDVARADVRDQNALRLVFEQRRLDVILHAAALKHLPMLEQYLDEAWKTNFLGTLNVLEAVDVETFINNSTDKVANSTSILGHPKRVAEKLTAWAAQHTGQRCLTVRFGNVPGSRGSMLPTSTPLTKASGPLTVTHPEVTQIFMTIPKACQLVLQAGGIGNAGELLILDIGQPMKILDVAQRMSDMSGQDIAIVYTGLRQGEKLHEELTGARESDACPVHPKMSYAQVDDLAPENLAFDNWLRICQVENADVTQILDVTTSGRAA